MATSPQRLTVLGETFEYNAVPSTAAEIAEHVEHVLAGLDGKFFHSLRSLILRHADTIEPEGAPRCDLVRRVFGEPSVRARILERGQITTEETRLVAVDLSYGQLVSLGSYQDRRMRYTPAQSKTLHVLALWIADGVTVGRGYELVESSYHLPVEVINVYRKPVVNLDRSLGHEQRETLRILLRDGMEPRQALETSALL
jgi:hypothetical protein